MPSVIASEAKVISRPVSRILRRWAATPLVSINTQYQVGAVTHCRKRSNPTPKPMTGSPGSAAAECHFTGPSLISRNYETTTRPRDADEMPLAIIPHAGIANVAWLVPAKAGEAGLTASAAGTQTHADGWPRPSRCMRHRPAHGTTRRIWDCETPMRRPGSSIAPPPNHGASGPSETALACHTNRTQATAMVPAHDNAPIPR